MSTLAEIEAAVIALPPSEMEALRRFLDRHLGSLARGGGPGRISTDLREFSGSIHLPEDPLEWQRQVRDEWA